MPLSLDVIETIKREKTAANTVFFVQRTKENTGKNIFPVLIILEDIFLCHCIEIITKNIHRIYLLSFHGKEYLLINRKEFDP
jgi:hypothetical protein